MPLQNKDSENQIPTDQVKISPPLLELEKILYTWKAPSRPFKKRSKEFWTKVVISSSLLGLIVFLAEGVMPVILIISLVFLFYVMSNVEPEEITYKITNRGIKIADKLTDLNLLTRYWFTKRLDTNLLVFETLFLPGRLELTVKKEDEEKIEKALSTFIIKEEVPPTRFDKVTSWFSNKLAEKK